MLTRTKNLFFPEIGMFQHIIFVFGKLSNLNLSQTHNKPAKKKKTFFCATHFKGKKWLFEEEASILFARHLSLLKALVQHGQTKNKICQTNRSAFCWIPTPETSTMYIPIPFMRKSKQIVPKKTTWQRFLEHLSDKNILMLRTLR